MIEIKSVWAVAHGSYSDFAVLCVADSKERAEDIARLLNASEEGMGDAHALKLPYIDREPERITTHKLQAVIFDDGTVQEYEPFTMVDWDFELTKIVRAQWRWVRAPIYSGQGGRLEVTGVDLKRVQKVFSDTRARLLADDVLRSRQEVVSG